MRVSDVPRIVSSFINVDRASLRMIFLRSVVLYPSARVSSHNHLDGASGDEGTVKFYPAM